MRMSLQTMKLFVITAVIALGSCKRAPEQVISARSAMQEYIQFEFAVYILPGNIRRSELQQLDNLSILIKTRYPKLNLVQELPEHPDEMFVRVRFDTNVRKDYPPPDGSMLEHSAFGLTPAQKKALQGSKDALILRFAHSKSQVWIALKTANELIEDVARQHGGVIWDQTTRQVFTPGEWHKTRLSPDTWVDRVPNIASQTVIHFYPNGEYAREITLGMEKFGLADVVVEELPQSSNGSVSSLINLYCQYLAENEFVNTEGDLKLDVQRIRNKQRRDAQLESIKPNGLGHACITLKLGYWEEGDPQNRLVELSGDRYSGHDSHAKQDNLISSLYGWDDKVHAVTHTAELLEESRKEKAELPELRKAFNAGLEPGEYIQLKAPFVIPDGGHEWMWVEVTQWNNGRIKGSLQNTPDRIPTLHSGQVVEINEDDVFDYIRYYADKHQEGNTTGRILEKMNQLDDSGHGANLQPEDPDCGEHPKVNQ